MPWRGRNRQTCKVCGKAKAEVGSFSARGKCQWCGTAMMTLNAVQLREHRGEFFDHWRRRCLASFGVMVETDER